jgi:hypothetical protein
LNTKSDYSSDIKVDLVEQEIPKLLYFDPSDSHDTNVKGKHSSLVFHLDNIVMMNSNDINQLSKDSFYSKALPTKIDYEKLSPYFAFRLHSAHMMLHSIPLSHEKSSQSRFQMLRHKMLNEVIATDTYFANEKSIEGYHCAQVFLE